LPVSGATKSICIADVKKAESEYMRSLNGCIAFTARFTGQAGIVLISGFLPATEKASSEISL